MNSSNTKYYIKLLEVHGFTNKEFEYSHEEQLRIKEMLEQYEMKLPRSNVHQRVLLKVLNGDLFR